MRSATAELSDEEPRTGFAVRAVRYAGGTHQPRHAHERCTVSLVLAGSVRESHGPHTVLGRTLQLSVKPRGAHHEDRFESRESVLLQLVLEPELAEQLADAGAPLRRWTWCSAPRAAIPFLRLLRGRRAAADATAQRALLDELVGAVDLSPRPTGPPPSWLRRVRERLDEACRYEAPRASVAELAIEAGVHRVHLTRTFRRFYGESPREYRARVRLRRAVERIAGGRAPLAETAFESGFADQAHMTRTLTERLGVAPAALRRILSAELGA